MKDYQRDFIKFVIETDALRFGEFTLKSGRISPHFFNSAQFRTGESISRLAGYYAQHLVSSFGRECQTVFGPAYKGIPLAVSTAIVLAEKHQYPIGYTFNRKETKEHGDGGDMVGTALKPGMPLVIVEDVITAGTTLREVVPVLREKYQVAIKGVIISLDRCERGNDGGSSAKEEAERELHLSILPLVTIYEVIEYLESSASPDLAKFVPAMREYLGKYGSADSKKER